MEVGRCYPSNPKPEKSFHQPPVRQFNLWVRTTFHRNNGGPLWGTLISEYQKEL